MKSIKNAQAKGITQEMLATFVALKQEKNEAIQRCDELRLHILSLLEMNVEVERGLLACRISSFVRHYFSARNLSPVMGPDAFRKIQSSIPAIKVKTLRIFRAGDSEDAAGEVYERS